MSTPVKVAGHPFHLMLMVFPLGLRGTAAIFDIFIAPEKGAIRQTLRTGPLWRVMRVI